jgi:uncharacterized protein (TIGR03067 family)
MILHLLLPLVATPFVAACGPDPNGQAGGPAPLQGEWQLVSTRDEQGTDTGCDESRMIVKPDGGVSFRLAGRMMNEGVVRLGIGGKLASLDLRLSDGRTLLAVYDQKGGDLVICFAEAGQDRPASLAPKGAQWAETWRRAKP